MELPLFGIRPKLFSFPHFFHLLYYSFRCLQLLFIHQILQLRALLSQLKLVVVLEYRKGIWLGLRVQIVGLCLNPFGGFEECLYSLEFIRNLEAAVDSPMAGCSFEVTLRRCLVFRLYIA